MNTYILIACCCLTCYQLQEMQEALLTSNRYRFMRAFQIIFVVALIGLYIAIQIAEGKS
jgi:hypothetical protein